MDIVHTPVLLLASPAIDTSILMMIILRAWFHDGCLECARSLSRSIPHIYCHHTIVPSQVYICPFVVPKPLRTGSFTFGSGVSASLLPRSSKRSLHYPGPIPGPQKEVYITLVRSQLLYCSQVWRPHLLKDILLLE